MHVFEREEYLTNTYIRWNTCAPKVDVPKRYI